jgi:hypothetical protein
MLMMLVVVLVVVLWSRQPSPSGRLLRHWLVERPAAALSRLTPGHLVLTLAGAVALAAAYHAFQGEGIRLVGSTFGETIAWYIAFDVGTWLEVFAVAWLLRATHPARTALGTVRTIIANATRRVRRVSRRLGRRSSSRRPRRAPPRRRNDDPDPRRIGDRRAGRHWRQARQHRKSGEPVPHGRTKKAPEAAASRALSFREGWRLKPPCRSSGPHSGAGDGRPSRTGLRSSSRA